MNDTALSSLNVRWMIRRDMDEVFAIDESRHAWRARSEDWFLSCLRQREVIGMVAENRQTGALAGFMVYRLNTASLDVIRIEGNAIALADMVDKLKTKLSSHKRTKIRLAVPERDTERLIFLRSVGFRALRCRRGRILLAYSI